MAKVSKLVRKMTLDEVWQECLNMWEWICKKRVGEVKDINKLKRQWLREHGYGGPKYDCFFCSWAARHPKNGEESSWWEIGTPWCLNEGNHGCPGRLVDKNFDCCRGEYHCGRRPRKFRNKLRRLDKKRLQNGE